MQKVNCIVSSIHRVLSSLVGKIEIEMVGPQGPKQMLSVNVGHSRHTHPLLKVHALPSGRD